MLHPLRSVHLEAALSTERKYKGIQLDPRLKKCAEFVRSGKKVADVGTDHGYLPIFLLQSEKANFALACDINKDPLDSAVRNAVKYGETERMRFVLSDGLHGLCAEDADDIVIAGMGGELILRIISEVSWLKDTNKHLVLQPMTTAAQLRRGLMELGFTIEREETVFDGKKIYSVMSVLYTGACKTEIDPVYEQMGEIVPGSEHSARYAQSVLHNLQNKKHGLEHKGEDVTSLQAVIEKITKVYLGE